MGFVYQGTMVDLGHGRGWMNGPAAASIRRLDARIGHPWQVTEAGRTWDEQNAHYQNYMRNGYPIALSPDAPSLHQRGNALDTDERTTWLLNEYGWFHTVHRWVNGVWTLVEPWHYEYFSERDNHLGEGPGEEEMSAEDSARLKNIEQILIGSGTSIDDPNWHAGPGSLMGRVDNIAGFIYIGGTSAGDPMYMGGDGTIYRMVKEAHQAAGGEQPAGGETPKPPKR
jgi:hypothetical protein